MLGARASTAQQTGVAARPSGASSPQGKSGPSFDCRKATTAYERLVCRTPELAIADRALATAYRNALATHPLPTYVRERQRLWLPSHGHCASGDQSVRRCLVSVYERIQELKRIPTAVYSDAEDGAFSYHAGHAVFELFAPTVNGQIPFAIWGGARILRSANAYTECHGTGMLDGVSGEVIAYEGDGPLSIRLGQNRTRLILDQDLPCMGFARILAGEYPAIRR